MVEENQFFREATLKICGSLEIEKALTKVLLYLRQFMPADALCLNVYDPALGVIELITGTGDFARNISLPFRMPLPQAAKKIMEDEQANPGRIPQVDRLDRLSDSELARPFGEFFNIPEASALIGMP